MIRPQLSFCHKIVIVTKTKLPINTDMLIFSLKVKREKNIFRNAQFKRYFGESCKETYFCRVFANVWEGICVILWLGQRNPRWKVESMKNWCWHIFGLGNDMIFFFKTIPLNSENHTFHQYLERHRKFDARFNVDRQ